VVLYGELSYINDMVRNNPVAEINGLRGTGANPGRQGVGIDRQVVVMNYFEPKEWEAPLWQGKTPVIWRHRTMEDYVKTFIKVGLTIVDMNEPRATDEQAEISVAMAWLQKIPLYLYWELRK
jgi:hypothetical protein